MRLVPLYQQILNITVAEIEYVIEPYGITHDIRWKSVTLGSVHPEIILYRELTCQYLVVRLTCAKPLKFCIDQSDLRL